MSEWTEARIAFLRKRWGEGATASTIARELNEKFGGYVSRNAVIGKASRIGLIGRPNPIKDDAAVIAENRKRTLSDRRNGIRLKRPKAATRADREASMRAGQPVGMHAVQPPRAPIGRAESRPIPAPIAKMASPFRTCQYLHGEAKLRNFCGAPTVPGHSWCEAHYIACHEKKPAPAAESEAA